MLTSTQQILYLVIAICIVWLTVFVCWLLYYAMRILRNANKIIEELRSRLDELTETIGYIRTKVEHISNLLTLAGSGVSGLVKKAVSRKAKEWIGEMTSDFDHSAKNAVDRAVEATAKKMKKTAARMHR